ncbi:hypothetical protein D3C75_255110 [compost metagenome]|nr:hypothetical protein R70331_20785 [Paenibacillus sp. FSL R7-0331]
MPEGIDPRARIQEEDVITQPYGWEDILFFLHASLNRPEDSWNYMKPLFKRELSLRLHKKEVFLCLRVKIRPFSHTTDILLSTFEEVYEDDG